MELRTAALMAWRQTEPLAKAEACRGLLAAALAPEPGLNLQADAFGGCLPGRPALPRLVPPRQVPKRSPHTPAGLAALVHSVAHIEFNAMNLALDAVWRFAGLPTTYYRDWARVAAEEAHHFGLLEKPLAALGHRYGDFLAHDGLWSLCVATAGDVLDRMAIVPRTLEARGLDASPVIQQRLRRLPPSPVQQDFLSVLDRILTDEEGHVALGNHWFRWLCIQRGLNADTTGRELNDRHRAPRPRPPFHWEARRRAGFSESELADLGDCPPARHETGATGTGLKPDTTALTSFPKHHA